MAKIVTYRERVHGRGWNVRFRLERESARRWLSRHLRRDRPTQDRPRWWWLANR